MSTLKMSKAQVLEEIHKDFAKFDAHGDGALNRDEITAILVKLQGSAPAGEVAGMLRFYNGNAREDARVSKPEFTRWFLSKHFGASGQRLNRLLIKDPLGAPKHTSFDLPPESFSYGRASKPDQYDAKATITGWYAPDQRTTRTGAGSKPRGKPEVPASVVFGRPSPVVTVKTTDILSNRYGGRPGRQEPEYPAHSKLSKPHVTAGAGVRPTRAFTMASAKTRALAAAAKSEEEGGRSAAAGTMLSTAIAAAATAAAKGGAGAPIRLKGEGNWKIKKFDKVRPVTESWAAKKPAAYQAMLRRTGRAPAAPAGAAETKAEESEAAAAEAEAEAEAEAGQGEAAEAE